MIPYLSICVEMLVYCPPPFFFFSYHENNLPIQYFWIKSMILGGKNVNFKIIAIALKLNQKIELKDEIWFHLHQYLLVPR